MNQNLKLTFSNTLLKQAALVGLVVFSSAAVFAIPSDRNQPISLVADRATYNEKTGVTTYTGNVIIEQGTMKLQANSIVANLNSQKQISSITATGGPARFQQQTEVNKGLAKGQAQ
ncbi:lipopolysaccharide transport periplasmic protein LptA, partial [Acinetobacter sp. UBA5934]